MIRDQVRILYLLFLCEKPTDLIESPTTINVYLEKLPLAFIFSETCDKVHLPKTTKYSEFILLNVVDCSDTTIRNTRQTFECFFLP